MEPEREQGPHGPPSRAARGSTTGRTVWLVGVLPATFYGVALAGPLGAAAGLVTWTAICALTMATRRILGRRRCRSGTVTAEIDPFEQLQWVPCTICGAPTLLESCLDCTEGPSHQPRRRRDDASPHDEPDDPVV